MILKILAIFFIPSLAHSMFPRWALVNLFANLLSFFFFLLPHFPFIYLLYLYCLPGRIIVRLSTEGQAWCVLCFAYYEVKRLRQVASVDTSSVGEAIMLTGCFERRERGSTTTFLIKLNCIIDELLYGIWTLSMFGCSRKILKPWLKWRVFVASRKYFIFFQHFVILVLWSLMQQVNITWAVSLVCIAVSSIKGFLYCICCDYC